MTAIAPDGTATVLSVKNTKRNSIIIRNEGSEDVFLGTDNTVTTSNGYPLKKDEELRFDDCYSPFWGITSGSAGDVRVLEVTAP